MYDFEASVQLVPTFYSHPVCRLLELQLILASEEDCVQLVPKYYSKVKLRSWQPPNILSEIMRLLQNGDSGIFLFNIFIHKQTNNYICFFQLVSDCISI